MQFLFGNHCICIYRAHKYIYIYIYISPFTSWQGTVVSCARLHHIKQLPPDDDRISLVGWKFRLRDSLPVWLWTVSITEDIEAFQVRLTHQRYRNRHFVMTLADLKAGVNVHPPEQPSLFYTSEYFMKMLLPSDFQTLQVTAEHLDGRSIHLGTTCSGTDIGVTAVKSMLKKLNRTFGVSWRQAII